MSWEHNRAGDPYRMHRVNAGPGVSARQIAPDDIYALGLAVGNILRDVDPAKRDQVLELIRVLERQARDG